MKKLALHTFTAVFALLISFTSVAQIFEPVEWSWELEYLDDGTAEVQFTAAIDEGWHIYALDVEEGGPLPTEFVFDENSDIEWVEEMQQPYAEPHYDNSFMMDLVFHEDGATFTRRFKTKKTTKIEGELSFMVCDDERCLPPSYVGFSFDVRPTSSPVSTSSSSQTIEQSIPVDGNVVIAEQSSDSVVTTDIDVTDTDEMQEVDEDEVPDTVVEEEEASMSIWAIFATGFGGGLLALFMPCIFPMIPLTVSFFTKQSKTRSEGIRKAIIYGISIIVIYVFLGMVITLAFGSSALNALATDPYFNIAFFLLFVIFAISFFGAFEITLPSSWVNKAENASNKGGLIGVFFMAFTLALVSFSCTGPIIGTLLVDAASKGEVLGPIMGMFGFSLALALPFMLFAAFPGWLNSLPKSGGWLNTVKVTLGFLELGFAMKFASTADLVLQAHILERELFLAIWVAIAIAMALYLFGAFRMPHDSPIDKIGVGRMLTGLFFLIFAFYTLPGVFGAPVKLLAGFPPPQHYSESPGGMYAGGGAATGHSSDAVNADAHCPPGINCFNDYDAALEYAKEVNKPLMLDFTGWGCVNCRKMEEQVWTDAGVMQRLNEDVVVVSLYVDERKDLPEDEIYVSEFSGKTIDEVGKKWSDFQADNFGNNSQPYYVILDHDDLTPLNGSAAYDPNIQKFKDWLDEGVAEFKKRQ